MFIKEVLSVTSDQEIELQRIAEKYNFCPRILNVEREGCITRIFMEHLEADCLAGTYGEDPDDVPEWIWDEIRHMVTTLYEEEGIEYRDITPYNFIEKDGRVYMIDFGDAKYSNHEPVDWFLGEFLDGENSWNPDYK